MEQRLDCVFKIEITTRKVIEFTAEECAGYFGSGDTAQSLIEQLRADNGQLIHLIGETAEHFAEVDTHVDTSWSRNSCFWPRRK